jgi:hypothetical protein
MGFEFMNKAMETGFAKFNAIGKKMFDVLNTSRLLRDNIKVFVLTHSEEIQKDFETVRKMKTLGKLLDSAITLEGLFTVLLYTHTDWDEKEEKGNYFFVTNKTSDYPAKSPYKMFDNIKIPNDLGFVADKIDEYNN